MKFNRTKIIDDATALVAERPEIRRGALPECRQAEALEIIADEMTMIRTFLEVLVEASLTAKNKC